jgi:hypothetical protein
LYLREDLTGDILCSLDNGVCKLLVVMVHKLDTCLSSLPTPTPSITLMEDLNLPRSSIVWSRVDGDDECSRSDLIPIVAGQRNCETAGGKQGRLQAFKLCDLATRHSLVQKVEQQTHGSEVLDLIFTNNPDLVGSVTVESWPGFTDHRLVTAVTSFVLGTEPANEDVHLLECGKRLKSLSFNKAQRERSG